MASKVRWGAQVALRTATQGVAGHGSGMLSAARTRHEIRVRRRAAPVLVDAAALAAAGRLHGAGYLLPDVRYPEDLVGYLRQGVAVAEDPATSVAMGGRIKESVRYAVDPLAHLPRLRELLTPELAGIVRAWYGTEFQISSVRLWRIAHIPPEEQQFHHYGNRWHLDGHPLDVLKMFVQVSEDTGADGSGGSALRLISRNHTRRALLGGYVNQERILPATRRFIEEHAVKFDGPPGSVLFVDTDRCLHRAGNPAPGTTRGMIQLMFLPSSTAPEGGDYFARIPPDPNVREGAIA